MKEPENDCPAPDELIPQQLGTAVLLCWSELPIKVQERILEQSKDMIGFKPIVGARKQIIELLMRHNTK
jgi:hypothetical protein